MERVQQVFVETVRNIGKTATLCIDVPLRPFDTVAVSDVQNAVARVSGVPLQMVQRLTILLAGQRLPLRCDECVVVDRSCSLPPVFRLTAQLPGGKGGFGSLLRSSAKKIGQKVDANKSASRDLNGRRLRHVETEKKIADWYAQHQDGKAPEYPLNKTFKNIKEGKIPVRKPCRFGEECKYKWKCPGSHPGDEARELEAKKEKSLVAEYSAQQAQAEEIDDEELHEDILSSVEAGLQAAHGKPAKGTKRKAEGEPGADDNESKGSGSGGGSGGGSGSGSGSSAGFSDSGELDYEKLAARPVKRARVAPPVPKFDGSSGSGSAEEKPSSATPAAAPKPKPAAAKKPAAHDSHHPAGERAAAPAVQAVTATAAAAAGPAGEPEVAVAVAVESKAAAPAAAAAAAEAEPAGPPPVPMDLSSFASAKALEAGLSADAIKAELTRLGLKAGGKPEERAERLFLLKSTPLDKLHKKHFAKK